jgi:hypothetical protein
MDRRRFLGALFALPAVRLLKAEPTRMATGGVCWGDMAKLAERSHPDAYLPFPGGILVKDARFVTWSAVTSPTDVRAFVGRTGRGPRK